MVPGEGLYLREIYFDIYTNKLQNLQANEARGAQKRKLEVAAAVAAATEAVREAEGSSSSASGSSDSANKVARTEEETCAATTTSGCAAVATAGIGAVMDETAAKEENAEDGKDGEVSVTSILCLLR